MFQYQSFISNLPEIDHSLLPPEFLKQTKGLNRFNGRKNHFFFLKMNLCGFMSKILILLALAVNRSCLDNNDVIGYGDKV